MNYAQDEVLNDPTPIITQDFVLNYAQDEVLNNPKPIILRTKCVYSQDEVLVYKSLGQRPRSIGVSISG